MNDEEYKEIEIAMQGEKKTEVLPPLRVTKSERDIIKEKAAQAGLSLSDYIRKSCIMAAIITPQPLADFKMVHALNKIGVLLNQYQHKMNATGQQIPKEFKATWTRLNQFLDEIEAAYVSQNS